jgi:chromosome segregation ATPase
MDTPLWERIGSDEFAELQQCREIIESLQQRVQSLEKINVDLEYRLEDQAKQCMAVEKECLEIEREWKAKCDVLENEISNWKNEYEILKLKGDRLRGHLSRTERELYGILQRKYELTRGPGRSGNNGSGSFGNNNNSSWDGTTKQLSKQSEEKYYQDEFLGTTQNIAPEEIRQRLMLASLTGFLGL